MQNNIKTIIFNII